jgi:hypothetical protein
MMESGMMPLDPVTDSRLVLTREVFAGLPAVIVAEWV